MRSPAISIFLLLLLTGGAPARPFDLRRDTFEFANETVFQYEVDQRGELQISRRDTGLRYIPNYSNCYPFLPLRYVLSRNAGR